jgi:hypothetical protein
MLVPSIKIVITRMGEEKENASAILETDVSLHFSPGIVAAG